ncbi:MULTISPECIES: hypothetical protein [Bacillus]|uniref:hypothetical protein n=1 Tax=Bacillus TaxID=1386 RepID=UPI002FBE922C
MISVIVNYIKEKSKVLYSIAAIGVIIYFICSQWIEVKNSWNLLFPVIQVILTHIPSLLLIIALIFTNIILFKISDEKSNNDMKEYFKSQKVKVETDKHCKLVGAVVVKEYEFFEGVETRTIKIKVLNKQEHPIELIEGFISFYCKNERVKVIPIEIKQLHQGYSERVYYNKIDKDIVIWDCFDLFITKMISNGKIETNLHLKSSRLYQTGYFVLHKNQFIDYKIFGIKTKYNLVWLKKKIKEGFLFIQFLCFQKEYFVKREALHKVFLKFLYRMLKSILVYGILCIFALFLIISILDVITMFKEVFNVLI